MTKIFFSKNPRSNLWLFGISTKHARIYSQGKYEYIYFYVTASLRIFKKRTDDHQMSTRNDIHILIGGYKEMPFSETRDYPYAYVNRKRTINAIHIFNMDDISVNPNRE